MKGLWALAGRGTGTMGIDNIKVKDGNYSTSIETITKSEIDYNAEIELYNLTGVLITKGLFSTINVPTGIYIVRQGNNVQKKFIKTR